MSFQSIFLSLQQSSLHRRVFSLAFPMVISNITIPLLGLVDASVIGHLDAAWYLGGVAMGSTLITLMLFMLGFLRMATTGLTAQAWGADDPKQLVKIFFQGIGFAGFFSILLIALHPYIFQIALFFSDASAAVKEQADIYFSIRILSSPAALMNMVIMGWLLGAQTAKQPMWMMILVNLVNIVLDVCFVLGLGWQVSGAAWASVIADYAGLAVGLYFVRKIWQQKHLSFDWCDVFSLRTDLGRILRLNRDIFFRSVCLQAVFVFMTFQGANLGDSVVAANAVLMNFLMLISFAMDGFAYAMEAMIGKAVGQKSKKSLIQGLIVITFWSLLISVAITLIFAFGGKFIINVISDLSSVRTQAYEYLPWLIALPLVSMWCFLLDGVFVGATQASAMRDTMVVALIGFFLTWVGLQSLGNHALWAAMSVFMALRGICLTWVLWSRWRKETFLLL